MQRCPNCDELIGAAAINFKEGVALCSHCDRLSRLSQLEFRERSLAQILSRPPEGCSIEARGQEVFILATLRSSGTFLFVGGLALFVNLVVSLLVVGALAGLYINLIGPLPHWLPTPRNVTEHGSTTMGLGELMYSGLFLLPFMLFCLGCTWSALLLLFGRIEIRVSKHQSWVATCLGNFRWKQRFDRRQVLEITQGLGFGLTLGGEQAIVLKASGDLRFGGLLELDRKQWVQAVLGVLLLSKPYEIAGLETAKLGWLGGEDD